MRRPLNASHCAGGAARAHVRTAGVNYKMRPLAFREINALSNCFSIRPRERGGGVARFFFRGRRCDTRIPFPRASNLFFSRRGSENKYWPLIADKTGGIDKHGRGHGFNESIKIISEKPIEKNHDS